MCLGIFGASDVECIPQISFEFLDDGFADPEGWHGVEVSDIFGIHIPNGMFILLFVSCAGCGWRAEGVPQTSIGIGTGVGTLLYWY
jgi:hypothetical protein